MYSYSTLASWTLTCSVAMEPYNLNPGMNYLDGTSRSASLKLETQQPYSHKSIPAIEIYKNPEFANHIFNYSWKTIEISQMKVIELPKLR